MKKSEVAMLFKEIDKYYLNRIRLSEEELMESVQAYYSILQDYELYFILGNLKKHVERSPHPPSIADLVRKPESEDRGRYIPNAEETRLLLQQRQLEIGQPVALTTEKKLELDARMKEIMEGVKQRARQSTYDPFSE